MSYEKFGADSGRETVLGGDRTISRLSPLSEKELGDYRAAALKAWIRIRGESDAEVKSSYEVEEELPEAYRNRGAKGFIRVDIEGGGRDLKATLVHRIIREGSGYEMMTFDESGKQISVEIFESLPEERDRFSGTRVLLFDSKKKIRAQFDSWNERPVTESGSGSNASFRSKRDTLFRKGHRFTTVIRPGKIQETYIDDRWVEDEEEYHRGLLESGRE